MYHAECVTEMPCPTLFLFPLTHKVGFVTFGVYAWVNADNPEERLTAGKAFVAISLFNILRFPLIILPLVVSLLVQVSRHVSLFSISFGKFCRGDKD